MRGFAQAEIAPLAADIDRTNQFPMHLWRKMGDLGLLGITVTEEYGYEDVWRPLDLTLDDDLRSPPPQRAEKGGGATGRDGAVTVVIGAGKRAERPERGERAEPA